MPDRKKPPPSLYEMATRLQPYELPRYSLDYEEKGPTHGVVVPGGGLSSGPNLSVQGGMDRARGIYPEIEAGYNVQRGPNQYGAGITYQPDPSVQGGPRQVPGLPAGFFGGRLNWTREF